MKKKLWLIQNGAKAYNLYANHRFLVNDKQTKTRSDNIVAHCEVNNL